MCKRVLSVLLLLSVAAASPSVPVSVAEADDVILLEACLVLPPVGGGGRSPVRVDPLELALIRGEFKAPQAGDTVRTWRGEEVRWSEVELDDRGRISDPALRGGYAFWQFESPREQTMILRARGHSLVYVNGELRGGDVYDYGYLHLPVQVRQGVNELLFAVARGQFQARLTPPPRDVYLTTQDATLPDLLAAQPETAYHAAAVVVNATARDVNVNIRAGEGGSPEWTVPALSSRKVPFQIHAGSRLEPGTVQMPLKLSVRRDGAWQAADSAEVELRVRREHERRDVTFISAIDHSVQYYSIVPARPLPGARGKPGIVLSLHGASVEARSQAGAYAPKSWCHIVCPTNRRPFGFDWEDWGRLDAMEVLAHAQATLPNDPSMVYLTGHSMGGHGTWSIGAHFPDRFAAIGPSAGWESFESYGGGYGHNREHPLADTLNRAGNPSRTLLHRYNYAMHGVYILHGDEDRSVPVAEARRMRDELGEFHTDLHYHEQPGAGHWWNAGNDTGTDCVDWAPMFELFSKRRLPAPGDVTGIDFTTVHPGNSADCHWATIHMQQVQLEPSRIRLHAEPNARRVSGTTDNVRRLVLRVADVLQPGEALNLRLDGQDLELPWPEDGAVHLLRGDDGWEQTPVPSLRLKGPHRYGQARNAMQRRFVLVYGTGGGPEVAAQMRNKARYDAEQWYYRANGSVDVVADRDFDPERYHGRDVVLYGNADVNLAFELVRHSPVQVRNGVVTIGDRQITEDGLAVVYCYPRPESTVASVMVIGGTCVQGMALTNRMAYFVSGAALPDVFVAGPEMLLEGTGGVRVAGWFDEEWGLDAADLHYRPEPEKD
jgi:dienelactone hydrolase